MGSNRAVRVAIAVAGAGLCAVAGCNIVAPAFLLVHGPEKYPAQFTLPEERPAVIFLDDRKGAIARRPTRDRMLAAAEQAMLRGKAVDRLIDSRAATTVVANEARSDLLSISEVGRAVNAEVVIYVVPETFTLSTDGQTFAPTARFRVKVMDATADARLWPEEREGFALDVVANTRQGTAPSDAAAVREAEEKFADLVGLRLAEMFYEHEKESAATQRDR